MLKHCKVLNYILAKKGVDDLNFRKSIMPTLHSDFYKMIVTAKKVRFREILLYKSTPFAPFDIMN